MPDTTASTEQGQTNGSTSTTVETGQGEGGQSDATDWRATLPDDLRDNINLGKFNGVDALAKGYVELSSLVGVDRLPDVPENPAEWTGFDKLGVVPKEDLAKALTRPDMATDRQGADGQPLSAPYNDEAEATLLDLADKAKLAPWQVQTIIDGFAENMREGFVKGLDDQEARAKEFNDRVANEWRDKRGVNEELARRVFKEMGVGEDKIGKLSEVFGGDFEMVDAFAKFGARLQEGAGFFSSGGGIGLSPDSAKAELQTLMNQMAGLLSEGKSIPQHMVDRQTQLNLAAYPGSRAQ